MAAILFLAAGAAAPLAAGWPDAPTVNLPVAVPAAAADACTMVGDGTGGFYCAWADTRSGAPMAYAQHVLASGVADPLWPADGRLVCNYPATTQVAPQIVSDDAGGCIVAWLDTRGDAGADIYAKRLLSSGAVAPGWHPDGVPVCTVWGVQEQMRMVADGAGGAVLAWVDVRIANDPNILALRVTAGGAVASGWAVNGTVICSATGAQGEVCILADGAGGALLAWSDARNTAYGRDIYAHHVLGTGVLDGYMWSFGGRWVTGAVNDQTRPALASDGAGGVYVCWQDLRSGTNADIYATRVLATGERDPHWPYAEQAVCTAGLDQVAPQLAPDGSGGFYALWEDGRAGGMFGDYQIFLQRMTSTGALAAGWSLDGLLVCGYSILQVQPRLAADGDGGAWVAWADQRSVTQGGRDIYAQRITGAGTPATGWPAEGRALCTAPTEQRHAQVVADPADGSLIVAWSDSRRGSYAYDLYAQRVDAFGFLGNQEPVIAGVRDVPWDQGGHVKVTWTASPLDTRRDSQFTAYDILRASPGKQAGRSASGVGALRPGDLVAVEQSGTTTWWEYLTSQPALHYVSNYAWVAPTTSDSLAAANPLTTFMVVGRNATGSMYWLSAPVSGYSVDNLGPAAPVALTGRFAGGATRLRWLPNGEADLAGYRLYRGPDAGFTPDAAHLVAAVADTGLTVAGDPAFFNLTAVDAHGNESPAALLAAGAISAVDGATRAVFSFAAPSPNPASGGTALQFSLSRNGNVTLVVHDLAGRRVRTLVDGALGAGPHRQQWDLRDETGRRVGAGLYIARLVTPEGERTQRMVILP